MITRGLKTRGTEPLADRNHNSHITLPIFPFPFFGIIACAVYPFTGSALSPLLFGHVSILLLQLHTFQSNEYLLRLLNGRLPKSDQGALSAASRDPLFICLHYSRSSAVPLNSLFSFLQVVYLFYCPIYRHILKITKNRQTISQRQ